MITEILGNEEIKLRYKHEKTKWDFANDISKMISYITGSLSPWICEYRVISLCTMS